MELADAFSRLGGGDGTLRAELRERKELDKRAPLLVTRAGGEVRAPPRARVREEGALDLDLRLAILLEAHEDLPAAARRRGGDRQRALAARARA